MPKLALAITERGVPPGTADPAGWVSHTRFEPPR